MGGTCNMNGGNAIQNGAGARERPGVRCEVGMGRSGRGYGPVVCFCEDGDASFVECQSAE